MNKFVIEIKPFLHITRREEIVIVKTDKDLDTTMELMQKQLKENNPMVEYDICGWESMDSFISSLSTMT